MARVARTHTLRVMQRFRQSQLDPHPLFTMVSVSIILYIFAGFFVYELITGSSKVGYGGTVSNISEVVWFGPIFVWLGVYAMGRRGPFTRLWLEPVTISVDRQGFIWSQGEETSGTQWDAVAMIKPSLWENTKEATYATILGSDGRIIAKVPTALIEIERTSWRRRRTTLMDLAVATRPDLFRLERHVFRRVVVAR
jgi:hypothetical protein